MRNKLSFAAAVLLFTVSPVFSSAMTPASAAEDGRDSLYETFRAPDSRYRPYVRWWWNGLRLDRNEILRELDILKEMGIGGVEINSIRFPDEADTLGFGVMPYLSDGWVSMVKTAAHGCRERDMTCDMIGGSGWPFGGEFLPEEYRLQMLTVETVRIDGGESGTHFSIGREEILDRVDPPIMSRNSAPGKELMYIRLMPRKVDSFTEGENYDRLADNDTIGFDVPAGEHVAYFFVKMTGYMNVIEGAPGACGPVLNHFDRNAVRYYLEKLSDAVDFRSSDMSGLVRAAFVDSFELEGANWCDTMCDQWERYYGYPLLPYLPYVIRKVGTMGDPLPEDYGCEFSDEVKENIVNRVRSDFEHFQIRLFRENFIDTFNSWCHRNGLESRIQAYGRALHPIESSMLIDIPECETWFRDGLGTAFPDREIYYGHAHSMINKFVASGSLLAGNGIVSCEEITNTGEIFQSTLEEIKIAGDMSNISGVNQSILHGFNYSPASAQFPGWIKFGEYFSEKNTMFPYYRLWTDYKARISALLQNSTPQADIALLPPLEDMWSELGQQRDPYPVNIYPDYAHDLWQNIHQNGGGCDYVSDNIICGASVRRGRLVYGDRSYSTVILMEVESMSPEAAGVLERFAASGGHVICIGKTPCRSMGMKDYARRSAKVKASLERIASEYPESFDVVSSPEGALTEWYGKLQDSLGIRPYVRFSRPVKWVFCNYYRSGDKDIFFLSNFSRLESQRVEATFPAHVSEKNCWVWIPETGERYRLPYDGKQMEVRLGPSESRFLVFDNTGGGEYYEELPERPGDACTLSGIWNVRAEHFDGSVKEFRMESLTDFNSLPFPWLRTFAGTVYYTLETGISGADTFSVIDLGSVRGVTELYLNGEKMGTCWYGNHRYDVRGHVAEGRNVITVKVTTPLGNYADSLTDNQTAKRYAHSRRSLGLEHDVYLY